jgi:hypothetical protein
VYVETFFCGGICSLHKSAKRVNIGKYSETENPILLPIAEKKQR